MLKIRECRALGLDEQIQKREELQKQLMMCRFVSVTGGGKNTLDIGLLRKTIARLNTLIHEQRSKVRE